MTYNFQLSCESTVDLPFAHMASRDVSVLFYTYTIDGEEFIDDMGRDPQALPNFYAAIAAGKMPSTSQINTYRYCAYFEELLEKGDVLHITLGTGMTPSYVNAVEAAEMARQKFPERKLIVIDSLASCVGYGLMLDEVADMRDAGKTIEEIEEWVYANRNQLHHQFFSTDLTMFRRSGRVSGPSATIGTILGICPLMRLNSEGRIIAYDKIRGKKKVMEATVETVIRRAQGGSDYNRKFYIGHSNCPEMAAEVIALLEEKMPNLVGQIKLYDIGTIIAAHCGPGTVACFFWGDEREL